MFSDSFCGEVRTDRADLAEPGRLERLRLGGDFRGGCSGSASGMEAEEQPVKKKRQGSKRAPKKESTGDSKMRSEASRALRENGETIANALAKKAADGDLKCIELLYKLSKDEAVKDAGSDGPALRQSYAVRFAVEQEWKEGAEKQGVQETGAATKPADEALAK